MKDLKIFINLTRLNRPIGYLLLFWPCSWGLAYSYSQDNNTEKFLTYMILFFFGSLLMRSAGCIVNDIVDKNLDRKVNRTKNRPLASNLITVKKALFYVLILCALAFIILIQFNFLTIILGLMSMTLAFSYPFMKRITYWPQLFLGLTFNWGIIMAYASINNSLSFEVFIIYIAAIFWTLGYDTIYGAQDMSDDEIIGLKSTSIKFKKNIKMFVSICYLLSFLILMMIFFKNLELNFFTFFLGVYFISLVYQIKTFNKNSPLSCLNAFKMNNVSGLLLFLSIYLI